MGLENFQGNIVEKPSTVQFSMPFRVEPRWIDENNHVSQGFIDDLFVRAQKDMIKHVPLATKAQIDGDDSFAKLFMRRKEIDFHKELKPGESGNVATIIELGNTSLRFVQQIYNQKRELVAEATYVTVLVGQDGQKREIAPEIKELIGFLRAQSLEG